MDDLDSLRLEALELEQSTGLLRLDYSTQEREGKLLYRFRLPSSAAAQSGVLPMLESKWVPGETPEVRDLSWVELPARVRNEALCWLRSQRDGLRRDERSALRGRLEGHIDVLERCNG